MLNKIEGQHKKIAAWTERIKKLESFQKNQEEQQINNTNTVQDIDTAQNFVSSQYDTFWKEHKQMKRQVGEMQTKIEKQETKLQKQENKSEQTMNYIKWDHAVFGGIPYSPGPDGIEN